jgi:lipoprotein-anchoring transpeptidase ErfK/SrfK
MAGSRPIALVACTWLLTAAAFAFAAQEAQSAQARCGRGHATKSSVGKPTRAVAWRAGLKRRAPVYALVAPVKLRAPDPVTPREAPWMLVLDAKRDAHGRCWVYVRLPWRPSRAAGWVDSRAVTLEPTPWRIEIARRKRTLTVLKAGARVRRVRVVVGAPPTPTPAGLFSMLEAVPWDALDFYGTWILKLSAHSRVLQEFDGGDGRVAVHGRGAASLLDPLGTARSHGCVRMANGAIDWVVDRIGIDRLLGTPVRVT